MKGIGLLKFLLNFSNNFFEERFLKRLVSLAMFTSVNSSEEMGRGVVASRVIEAGTLLGIYPGTYISHASFLEKEEFISRSVKSAYMHSEDIIIDPTDMFGFLPDIPDSRIAMINEPPLGLNFNVIAVSTKKYVWYLAIDEIAVGDQLFTNYGSQYQRTYSSSNVNHFKLNEAQTACINRVAKKYSWIKQSLLDYLAILLVLNLSKLPGSFAL